MSRTRAESLDETPTTTKTKRRQTPRDSLPLNNVGDLVFQQPIQTIALEPVSGKPITRLGILVWLWVIQRAQNSPPAAEYVLPLTDLMGYLDTKHYAEVQDVFRSLASTAVEWNEWRGDTESWGVAALLAQAEVVKYPTHIDLKIQLPRRLEEGIRARQAFSELNLMMVRRMRTTPAVMLYRLCAYYATNPSRLTNRAAPTEWYSKITGKPLTESFQVKVFNRDVLQPAIAEVNAVTDVHVELITHRRGRRIEEMQFKVQHVDEYREAITNDGQAELTKQLLAIGIKVRDVSALIRRYSADRIQRNLTYTLARNTVMGTEMKNAAAYLKSAIKSDYSGAAAQPEVGNESPKEKLQRLRTEYQKVRIDQAEARIKELTPPERETLWADFIGRMDPKEDAALLKRAESKPNSALVQSRYRAWLADRYSETETEENFTLFLATRIN